MIESLKNLKDGDFFYLYNGGGSFAEKWMVKDGFGVFVKDSFSPRNSEPKVRLDSNFWNNWIIVPPNTPIYTLVCDREEYHYVEEAVFDQRVNERLEDYRIYITRPVITIEELLK